MMVKNRKKKISFILLLALLLALVVTTGSAMAAPYATVNNQQGEGATVQQEEGTILDVLQNDARLSMILDLVEAGALVDNLSHPGHITFFAPTNEAFAAFNAAEHEANLTEILLYHVASGRYPVATLADQASLTTWLGDHVEITTQDDTVTLDNSVHLVGAPVQASNGVVYVIDTVLIPELEGETADDDSQQAGSTVLDVLRDDSRFSTMLTLVEAAALADNLDHAGGQLTFFVPTEEAFAAFNATEHDANLTEILLYHVASGRYSTGALQDQASLTTWLGDHLDISVQDGVLMLDNSARLTGTAIETPYGIVHMIDTVLIPELEEQVSTTEESTETAE
jgi:transforming growth factor-beta-induced protein